MHPTVFTAPTDDREPLAAVAAALTGVGFIIGSPVASTRTLLDTFDGRLHAAGLRLVATGPGSPELLLESTSAQPPARLATATVPRWPADLPAGPLLGRLAAVCRERALLPAITMTSRLRMAAKEDRRGKVVARAELHSDIALAASRGALEHPGAAPAWIAEVIPVVGHDADSEAAGDAVAATGAASVTGGIWGVASDLLGVDLDGFRSSPSVPMAADDDALDVFRGVLANLAATIAANRPGAVDDIDPEFLHELRVAVRRTRSILGAAKGILPDPVRDELRDEFRWFGQVTTPARDLDVYLLEWDELTAPLGLDAGQLDPIRAELQDRQAAAHHQLAADLRSERSSRVLDGWGRWLGDPGAAPAGRAVGPVVARRVRRHHAAVIRDGRAITDESPGERLHELRKDAKKLRYLLECFGPLYPTKPHKAFVKHLKALQDNLGAHQDAEVHLGQLTALAHDLHADGRLEPGTAIATGRLVEHLHDLRQAERRCFAARFANFDTKATAASLRRMLDRLLAA